MNEGIDSLEVADISLPEVHEPDSIMPCYELIKGREIALPGLPRDSRREIQERTVMVHVLIDTNGSVIQVKIVSSPHPRLDELVVEAAKQWKFSPPREVDRPTWCYVRLPLNFRPKEK